MALAQEQTYRSWNRIESSETESPHTFSQLIFNKGGKNTQQRKDSLFSKEGKNIPWRKDSLFSNLFWESWTAAHKPMELEHTPMPYTKINSKWLKDLHIRHDTIKPL